MCWHTFSKKNPAKYSSCQGYRMVCESVSIIYLIKIAYYHVHCLTQVHYILVLLSGTVVYDGVHFSKGFQFCRLFDVLCNVFSFIMEYQHVNPEESVKIHQDIRSKQSIGMHWGTFTLSNEVYTLKSLFSALWFCATEMRLLWPLLYLFKSALLNVVKKSYSATFSITLQSVLSCQILNSMHCKILKWNCSGHNFFEIKWHTCSLG